MTGTTLDEPYTIAAAVLAGGAALGGAGVLLWAMWGLWRDPKRWAHEQARRDAATELEERPNDG